MKLKEVLLKRSVITTDDELHCDKSCKGLNLKNTTCHFFEQILYTRGDMVLRCEECRRACANLRKA